MRLVNLLPFYVNAQGVENIELFTNPYQIVFSGTYVSNPVKQVHPDEPLYKSIPCSDLINMKETDVYFDSINSIVYLIPCMCRMYGVSVDALGLNKNQTLKPLHTFDDKLIIVDLTNHETKPSASKPSQLTLLPKPLPTLEIRLFCNDSISRYGWAATFKIVLFSHPYDEQRKKTYVSNNVRRLNYICKDVKTQCFIDKTSHIVYCVPKDTIVVDDIVTKCIDFHKFKPIRLTKNV